MEEEGKNELNEETQCFICNSTIEQKPWITVQCEDYQIHGCSYLCANQFRYKVGYGYWDNVVNKEDFNEPRPVFGYTNQLGQRDITTGFGMDKIRDEIQKEDQRVQMIEEEYENSNSSDNDSDEVEI